jgi:hypothetical protein
MLTALSTPPMIVDLRRFAAADTGVYTAGST